MQNMFAPTNPLFVPVDTNFEVNPASISFGDITGFKTVVCLFIIIIGIIVITIIILVGLTCICT